MLALANAYMSARPWNPRVRTQALTVTSCPRSESSENALVNTAMYGRSASSSGNVSRRLPRPCQDTVLSNCTATPGARPRAHSISRWSWLARGSRSRLGTACACTEPASSTQAQITQITPKK